MVPRSLFGQGDGFLQRGREQLHLPYCPDPDPFAVDLGVDCHRTHLVLDDRDDSVQFYRGTGEIFGGEGKEGRDLDLQLLEPVHHLLELVCADPVPRQGVLKPEFTGVPSVPV